MHRREFLGAAAAAPWAVKHLQAEDRPTDARITRVVGFTVTSQRSKVAGKNARLDVHGDQATDRWLRIYTNTGVEGLGDCRADEKAAAQLLGKDPLESFDAETRRMTGPLGVGTMPLWDLAGKLLEKPVYELLGGRGESPVPVYDGSIYFADLLPQYADKWQDRFREEIDMGLERGHRAFKIKIGRGHRWLPRADGNYRDWQVIRVIREHGGKDILLGVDANNGYDLLGAKQLFSRITREDVAFAEEMFPETVEDCLEFKQHLRDKGLETLVADGETQSKLKPLRPFMKPGAIEVYQADMRRFGFEGILQEAAWAEEFGHRVAPHNWGSWNGFFMQLQIARAIPNFYRAEHDPLSNDVFTSEGYEIKEGYASVPDVPGCGLGIREEAFARDAKILYDVRA